MKPLTFVVCLIILHTATTAQSYQVPPPKKIDETVKQLMEAAEVTGLSLSIIEDGKIKFVRSYGYKNRATKQMNDTSTCFYGASLCKPLFAYIVMQLVDKGLLDLDKPLYTYLPKPLPEYKNYADLADDPRWKLITARHCLDHTTGFPNWRQFNPRDNKKLEIFFTPGQRYAYSGEGLVLLQLVVETITGQGLEALAQENIFQPFGMTRSSFLWQPAFETDYALAHDINEDTIAKDKRTRTNAAGSMETTIADYTRFVAAVIRGERISASAKQEMFSPQISIHSKRQFPSLDTATTHDNDSIGLAYGLGWGLFNTSLGKAFFKEGHGDGWVHYMVSVPSQKMALTIMSNSANGESIFPELVKALTGITLPAYWEGYTPYQPWIKLPARSLDEYTGEYTGKQRVTIAVTGTRLKVSSSTAGLPPTNFYASDADHFFIKTMDIRVTFIRDEQGKIIKAEVDDEGEKYTLTKQPPVTVDIQKLPGNYAATSEHSLIVTFEKGKLFVEATNPKDRLSKLPLLATTGNEFYIKEAPLRFRFVMGADGKAEKLITYNPGKPETTWTKTAQ